MSLKIFWGFLNTLYMLFLAHFWPVYCQSLQSSLERHHGVWRRCCKDIFLLLVMSFTLAHSHADFLSMFLIFFYYFVILLFALGSQIGKSKLSQYLSKDLTLAVTHSTLFS